MYSTETIHGLKNPSEQPQKKSQLLQRPFQSTTRFALPHWCHLEAFLSVFLLSLIAQQCSPGHATLMFASLAVNALVFWVLYLNFISPQSLFLFIAPWNISLYPKMHLVLSACPISHLSAHTFFNSAVHSLIIHQSIYTFSYLSSHSPFSLLLTCSSVTSLIFTELSCLSPVGPAGLALPEYQTVCYCIPSCTQNCHQTSHSSSDLHTQACFIHSVVLILISFTVQ